MDERSKQVSNEMLYQEQPQSERIHECALHPQAYVNRLYLKRSEGGRGMIGVEDCVTIETNSLMSYIKQHANEKALKAVAREQVLKVRREGMDKKSLREERREKYLAKPLHGQFF